MADLKLYNSLSKKTEPFARKGSIKMYSCGPTVYDFAHIGNLRYFVSVDVLRRYLEYKGFKVKQVMNITDVGHMMADSDEGLDKIEEAAKKAGASPKEIAEKFTKIFFKDVAELNIEKAWKYPAASKHIAEMIKIIGKLLKKGIAYKVGGNVYYNLSKFPKYGKLSGNTIKNLMAGARVEVIEGKKSPYDFALWISKPGHLMVWKSPWSTGYPGWHIECSAMAGKYLGETLDIHTGGEDNKFPHHEAEIAQSEGANSKELSRFWFHVSHLLVNGEKMSKSLGNFYTLSDITRQGYSSRELRYLLLSVHYRDSLNFTLNALDSVRPALARLDEFLARLGKPKAGHESFKDLIAKTKTEFETAMDDDLNISAGLASLWNFVRLGNAVLDKGAKPGEAAKAKKFVLNILEALGLKAQKIKSAVIPPEVLELGKKREEARMRKDWKLADELRVQIRNKGFEVEDVLNGPNFKRI